MNKLYFKSLLLLVSIVCFNAQLIGQMNANFFPNFQAYAGNPIIHYGDGFADASWNDPCVLKQGNQYIMYITAAEGIILSDTNTVKVYRKISSDGYNWTLSPTTPVLEPIAGTFYEGGTETPSVVYRNGIYHMYLTAYPPGNVATDFVLSHATSTDGISFTMDANPILTSDGSSSFYGDIIGEPGAIIYHDSIYVFFTASGTIASTPSQSIGLIKSPDGSSFSTPESVVSIPNDVYPVINGYWGLSTPSALAINDSIYLFTDVAQTINGNWTQVALHQFKTDGQSGIWHHDLQPIHTKEDFSWTDGDYLSEIRSITPLLEENGLLRIWYAGNRIADFTGTDTLYHVTIDGTGFLHVDPAYWGIGTSEFQFDLAGITDQEHSFFQLYPNPSSGCFTLFSEIDLGSASIEVYSSTGRLIKKVEPNGSNFIQLDLTENLPGIYLISVKTNDANWTSTCIKY